MSFVCAIDDSPPRLLVARCFLSSSIRLASSAASRDKSRKTRSRFSSMSSLVGLERDGEATCVARDQGMSRVLSQDDIV